MNDPPRSACPRGVRARASSAGPSEAARALGLGLALVLGVAAAGCRSYHEQVHVGALDQELARRDAPEGRKEVYRLEGGAVPALVVAVEHDRARPFLGLQLAPLDAAQAARRGLQPYAGVVVRDVYPGSGAEAAGVRPGDVLLTVDGRPASDPGELLALERRLMVGREVPATVWRDAERLDVTIAAKRLVERVTDREPIALEVPTQAHRPYAGLTLRGIPVVWCERIFGVRRHAVVVTSVEVGSPGWCAGLRGGDVIDTVDGAPAPSVDALSARIAERGPRGEPIELGVHRAGEPPHAATVWLHDYSGERTLWLPLVLRVENGTFEDSWSVGPFGLLLRNRNQFVASDASSREPLTRNVFDALLGLVHVESAPSGTAVRLLWFLHL